MEKFSEFVDKNKEIIQELANTEEQGDMQEPTQEYGWMKDPQSKAIFLILRRAWDLMKSKQLDPEKHIAEFQEMIMTLASGRRSINGTTGISSLVNRAAGGSSTAAQQNMRRSLQGNRRFN